MNRYLNSDALLKVLFSKTTKNTVITLIGNILNAIVVLILTVVVSRFLGPSKFGLFSVALTLYLVTYDLFGFGVEQGVVRFISVNLGKNDPSEALKYAKAAFKIRLLTSFLLILCAFFVSEPLAVGIFNDVRLVTLFRIVFLGQVFSLMMGLVVSILQAYQRFISYSLLYGITGFVRLSITTILLLTNTATIENLLATFVFSTVVSFVIGLKLIPQKIISVKDTKDTFINMFNFSKWIVLWAVTASIHSKIDILLIAKILGDYQTGIYSAASRITLGIVWLNSAIAQVLTPKYSRYRSNDELKSFISKGFLGISILLIIMLVGIILSPVLFPLIFGKLYLQSIQIFQLLMVGMIFFVLSTPSMVALSALGKSNIIGLISLCQVPIVLFGNLFLIPIYGITGSAVTSIFSNLFVFVVSLLYVFHITRKKS